MNPIETQRLIINQLYQIVRSSCPAMADSAICRFDYQSFEDGSSSVGQQFEYMQAGISISATLDRKLRSPVMSLVKELHSLMKAHTGGDWQAFTLIVNSDDSVTTRFEYPDEK